MSTPSNNSHIKNERKTVVNRLTWALIITIAIFLLELFGGFLSNSLSLKSDAAHLFGDVLALGLSYIAARLALLPPSSKRTFGYHRAEVLAAVFNGVTLFLLAGYIFFEAYHRFLNPQPIKSGIMFIVALIGLAGNLYVIFKLHSFSKENLNVRAAYLHIIGDMLGSVGVVAGSLIIILTGSFIADPIISVFIAIIIIYGAFSILIEGANILLEGTPLSINYKELKSDIEKIAGITSVHDLHVWTISSSNLILTAHIKIDDQPIHNSNQILTSINSLVQDKYGIRHTTIQSECGCCQDQPCGCDTIADN